MTVVFRPTIRRGRHGFSCFSTGRRCAVGVRSSRRSLGSRDRNGVHYYFVGRTNERTTIVDRAGVEPVAYSRHGRVYALGRRELRVEMPSARACENLSRPGARSNNNNNIQREMRRLALSPRTEKKKSENDRRAFVRRAIVTNRPVRAVGTGPCGGGGGGGGPRVIARRITFSACHGESTWSNATRSSILFPLFYIIVTTKRSSLFRSFDFISLLLHRPRQHIAPLRFQKSRFSFTTKYFADFPYKKKKVPKFDTEETPDYTKLLTLTYDPEDYTDTIIIESDEDDSDIAEEPEKIKSAKKAQALKKEPLITIKENKLSKKNKETPGTKTDKPTEKPNWKEFKKEKQELRHKRKLQKCPFYETVQKAKQVWENVRRDDCPKEKKETLLNELFKFSKSHLETMVYSHDTARIVQWMLKIGTPEIRSQVINELIQHVPKMLLSKYACLCVKKMLKKGDAEQRKIMINSLKGKIYTLTIHSNAAKIMDMIYVSYATPEQQNNMMHELYGASSILCDTSSILSFSAVLKNSPNTKDIILAKTKDHIKKFVLKQKSSMQTTLVHNLIHEYVLYMNGKGCEELLASLKELPLEVFYTSKSGCLLAMYIIWSSTPKEKKAILKQIKTSSATRDLATSEYGYLILLALFDCVDDTVIVKKVIIPEIFNNLDTIAIDDYGRKVILYLVAWRDSSYYHPRDIELLKKGDLIKECKKDDDLRVKELLSAVSDRFLQHIQENPHFWLSTGSIAMVMLGILKSGRGEKLKEAMTSVANYLIEPNNKIEEKEGQSTLYEHAGLHIVLKKIFAQDQTLAKNCETSFSEILSSVMTNDILKLWIKCNRGCFLIIGMIESNIEPAVQNIKSLFTPITLELLKNETFSGAKILATKLKSNTE